MPRPEGQPVPEMRKELLRGATQDVVRRLETRGNSWNEIAQRNFEYGPKIIELGDRMDIVEGTEKRFSTKLSNIFENPFASVKSPEAREFLGKVLGSSF